MKIINVQFDVIVIGSGPGGATVAKELTERKKKVLILEWGSNTPVKGTLWQALLMAGIPEKGTGYVSDDYNRRWYQRAAAGRTAQS